MKDYRIDLLPFLSLEDQQLLDSVGEALEQFEDEHNLFFEKTVNLIHDDWKTFYVLNYMHDDYCFSLLGDFLSGPGYSFLTFIPEALRKIGAFEYASAFENSVQQAGLTLDLLNSERLQKINDQEYFALCDRLESSVGSSFCKAFDELNEKIPFASLLARFVRTHAYSLSAQLIAPSSPDV